MLYKVIAKLFSLFQLHCYCSVITMLLLGKPVPFKIKGADFEKRLAFVFRHLDSHLSDEDTAFTVLIVINSVVIEVFMGSKCLEESV